MFLVYSRSDKYSLRLKIDYQLVFLGECPEFKTNSGNYSFTGVVERMAASEYFKEYPLSITQVALESTKSF